ncbi:MAG: YifB family Mg chelatase-like AAA ATPase [Planctomycetales bacterium]
MLAKLSTYSLFGIHAIPVEAEVDISPAALPKTILVGLAEAAARESIHRMERALVNSGYVRPSERIVINLSPAELPKEASSFDLPTALGLLAASGQLASERFEHYAAVGELALEGTVRPVKGALSMAIAAREQRKRGLVVPLANAQEAAVVEGVEIIPVGLLAEAVGFYSGQLDLDPVPFSWNEVQSRLGGYEIDYADVKGQEMAKRAAVVAAAGGHHLLMIGSPGTGKTLLAQRLATILPELSPRESVETTQIYSVLGQLCAGQALLLQRPFRAPHHTVSEAGLVGGGSTPTPGEISMAHNGVLFLDELPEFNRRTLEVLRQPLESGNVTISRAVGSVTFPANLMLVAALNPCPCGYRGDPRRRCQCNPMQIERYIGRISGPLLDRIDIHLEVPAVPFRELADKNTGTTSAQMRSQVVAARALQQERFQGERNTLNGRMTPRQIRRHCQLDKGAEGLLKNAMDEMGLSARAHDKILRVARTIADLDSSQTINSTHLNEAINYRTLDRNFWA